MKKLLIAVLGASVSFALMACTDYQGEYSEKYEASVSEEVLPVPNNEVNTIVDKRDKQSYEIVQIGSQTWFAQNLNYKDGKGKCPADKDSLCAIYGRLYDANSILKVVHIGDSSQKDAYDGLVSLCPEGWRVPNKSDWKTLVDYVTKTGDKDEVGKNLKASEGWYKDRTMIQDANNDCHFAVASGDNPFGFSAYPSGICRSSNCDVGADAYFWGIADTVLAKSLLPTILVGYKLSYENDDFVEDADVNYSNNPRAAIRCIQGEIEDVYVDRSSVVQLEDDDIEKDTTDLTLSSSADVAPSSAVSSSDVAVSSSPDSSASSDSVVALSSSEEARSSNSVALSSSIAASSSSNAALSSTSVAQSSSSAAKSSSSVAQSSSSTAKSSSSVAKSSSSSAKSSSSVASTAKYDCSLYDCVTTKYLNQDMLAAGMYDEYLDTRDNQVYRTIKIGSQTWFAQNLNYKVSGSVCNSDNCATYGRYYDWESAVEVCPSGWHLSSKDDWDTLLTTVGNPKGLNIRSLYTWDGGANTDKYGFSALATGSRQYSSGSVLYTGVHVGFWTSTEASTDGAVLLFMDYRDNGADFADSEPKYRGFSVRCLKGTAQSTPKSSSSSVTAPNSSSSVSSYATEYDCTKYNCVTTEYLNQEMLAAGKYGEYLDVRDTQVYRTVTIGKQTWMAQNLNYKMKVSYCLNDSVSYCAKYGRLYQYDSASSACPSGWRMPTIEDWRKLDTAVGLSYKALWSTSFYSGTDDYGFSGVPTSVLDGNFASDGYIKADAGFWWSSTPSYSGYNSTFELYKGSVYFGYYGLKSRLAVRCIMK